MTRCYKKYMSPHPILPILPSPTCPTLSVRAWVGVEYRVGGSL